MGIPTALELKEIFDFFDDDQEIGLSSMTAIYNTYERGYKQAQSGYTGKSHCTDIRLTKVWELGYKKGEFELWG